MKSLLTALCLFVTVSAFGANFPYIRLNNQTNRISDNGSAMTFNGVAVGTGGGGFVGAVSNSVVTSGLLAVGTGKTNGIAATFAHVTNAMGVAVSQAQFANLSDTTGAIGAALDGKAALASPALTGTPTINGASIETELTNKVSKAGDQMTGTLTVSPAANTGGISVTNYSKTTSNSIPILNIAGTWNNGTGTNTAVLMNVTDTASGTSSAIVDLQVNSTSKLKVEKSGIIYATGNLYFPTTGSFLMGKLDSTAGFYVSSGGTGLARIIGAGFSVGISDDCLIYRDAANVMQLGTDAATATAQAIKAHDGSGTDKSGASLTIEGGQSTGTAAGGATILRTANSGGTSGSTANAYSERFHAIPKWVTLTDNTLGTLFTIPVPATNYVGLTAVVTIYAADASVEQSQTTTITVDATAHTTTITGAVTPSAAQTGGALPSGTLSTTYSVADAGSNVLAVKCTADTSLTPTVLRAKITITAINSNGTGAITEQ